MTNLKFSRKRIGQALGNAMRVMKLFALGVIFAFFSLAMEHTGQVELARANPGDAEHIIEAIKAALASGDRSGLATLIDGARAAALGVVNVWTKSERDRLGIEFARESGLKQTKLAEQIQALTEIINQLESAKNRCNEEDDGWDPFFGVFTSDVPLVKPLPPTVTLTLDKGSAVSYLVNPALWGGGTSNPAVVDASMTVNFSEPTGTFKLSPFSVTLGPFPIKGTPSGTNIVSPRPNAPPGKFRFTESVSQTVLGFEAHYEGTLHNALYPPTNPIVYLSDIQGYVNTATSKVVIMATDPMIVPGAPGVQSPAGAQMDVGVRAVFNAASKTLSFGENTDLLLIPDVTIVRNTSGVYISQPGQGEPVIGAEFVVAPLTYLGRGPDGSFRFSNAAFRIRDSKGTYASGNLTDVHIDPRSYEFLASVVLDSASGQLSSPFIDHWKSLSSRTVRLLGPIGALELIVATREFTTDWTTGSNWISLYGSAALTDGAANSQMQESRGGCRFEPYVRPDLFLRLPPDGRQPKDIEILAFNIAAQAANGITYGRSLVIANEGSNSLATIDLDTRRMKTVAVGSQPHSVEVDSKGRRAFVGNFGSGNVSVVDMPNQRVIETIRVGNQTTALALDPTTNKLYATNFGDNNVTIVQYREGGSQVVGTVRNVRQPLDVKLSPD
jgi:YVTN family beta-propeller protein